MGSEKVHEREHEMPPHPKADFSPVYYSNKSFIYTGLKTSSLMVLDNTVDDFEKSTLTTDGLGFRSERVVIACVRMQ